MYEKVKVESILNDLTKRYPVLQRSREEIWDAYLVLEECFATGHKLLLAGNGGSAADTEHIAGELMKGFIKERALDSETKSRLTEIDAKKGAVLGAKLQGALPALSLNTNIGLNTAFLNDVDGVLALSQAVYGYGCEGDVFLGISTSGNSVNVNYAAVTAKAKGLKCIALTGKDGGELRKRADVAIVVGETETYKIQELHLPVYHALCLMLEERFFG